MPGDRVQGDGEAAGGAKRKEILTKCGRRNCGVGTPARAPPFAASLPMYAPVSGLVFAGFTLRETQRMTLRDAGRERNDSELRESIATESGRRKANVT